MHIKVKPWETRALVAMDRAFIKTCHEMTKEKDDEEGEDLSVGLLEQIARGA